jgi:hypothetical protein
MVTLDRRSGSIADATTPPDQVVERVYLALPPDLQEWAREEGIPHPPRAMADGGQDHDPVQMGDAQPAFVINDPEPLLTIVCPDPDSRYRRRASLPAAAQRIEVVARPGTGAELREVTISVDDRALATLREPPYRAWWPLEPGEHSFRAEATDGRGRESFSDTVRITVLE